MGVFDFLRGLFGGAPRQERRRRKADESEVTRGGSRVLRHQARTRPPKLVLPVSEHEEIVSKHVEAHVGPIQSVFHEIVSDLVHMDVLIVAPRPERNYWTLVTSGMSDLPMTTPRGAEELSRAELMLCLPPTWSMSEPDGRRPEYYWPIQWLKGLARLPHELETWLGDGHTIPNGDPAQPLDASVGFTGWLLTLPRRFGGEFLSARLDRKTSIHFYAIFPLYSDEMDLKLEKGAEHVNELLDQAGVSELLDPRRPSVAR